MIVREKIVMVGIKAPVHIIFLFNAYGQWYKNIELESLIDGIGKDTKWAMMAFNSDEDIVLLDADGRLFIIDIFMGVIKQRNFLPNFNTKQT